MKNTDKNKNPVSQILRHLLSEAKIKESELARKVNLPQTTINRLLLGGTLDPRANTLKPIADFFGITIGQLCGFEPLSSRRIPGITSAPRRAWQFIPIIEWDQITSWIFTKKNFTPLQHSKWISTEREISDSSFGLYSLPSMEPRFRKGSVLIVDPDAKFKDGHYIILAFDGIHPTVRKIVVDGHDIFLKAFDSNQPTIKLISQHIIFGTIVESRLDIYNA